MDIETLICGFGRPEYPKNPEGLQSALAWRIAKRAGHFDVVNDGNGLVYEVIRESSSRMKTLQTRPPTPRQAEFVGHMREAGLIASQELSDTDFCSGLLDTLSGVIPAKAKAKAAVPMTMSMAYMQDAVGLHSKKGPPNFGLIIEQLFDAGCRDETDSLGASNHWWNTLVESSSTGISRNLDLLFSSWLKDEHSIDPQVVIPNGSSGPEKRPPQWLRGLNTPYSWFNEPWQVLCQPSWRTALPVQRWSDWASCVLRTAIGMGFIWEAELYRRIGNLCLREDYSREALSQELKRPFELITWRPSDLPLTVLDQNSALIRTVIDGVEVRAFFAKVLENPTESICLRISSPDSEESFQGFLDLIEHVRSDMDESRKADLAQCYGGPRRGAAKNTIETITYLLQCRQTSGRGADFYSLLSRRSRRFLVVDPGEEWIVVLASLATGGPRSRTVLGTVKNSLKSLGLFVDRETLVDELERAGLTSSSHDADDAIEVWSGF